MSKIGDCFKKLHSINEEGFRVYCKIISEKTVLIIKMDNICEDLYSIEIFDLINIGEFTKDFIEIDNVEFNNAFDKCVSFLKEKAKFLLPGEVEELAKDMYKLKKSEDEQ